MQEVFEKIIEKLEERTFFLSDCTKYGNKDTEQQNKSYSTMMMYEVANLVEDLIDIVKQAAAEYKENDAFNRVYEKVVSIEREYAENGDIENVNRCIKLENLMQYFKEELKGCNNGYNNGWIPCSEPPKTDDYILLSFENFSIPLVGRYEEDEEGSSYYVGDDDEPCVSQNIIVDAWQPLPKPYQPKGE